MQYVSGFRALVLALASLSPFAHAGERLVRENGQPLRSRIQAEFSRADLESCGELASTLRSKDQILDLKRRCSRHEFAASSIEAIKMSEDASIVAFAHDRALFVQERKGTQRKSFVISGPATRLRHVSSVSIDSDNREILVLTSNPAQILVFAIGEEGNIAPLRFVDNPEIEGASSLALDSLHNEILVANPSKGAVQVLKRLANKYGPRETFSQDIQRSLRVVQGPRGVASLSKSGQIAVLTEGGKVLRLGRLDVLGTPITDEALSRIKQAAVIAASSESLEWINADGSSGHKKLGN
jgi:hypothetical protein